MLQNAAIRLLFRLPVVLYRARLGALLGQRFLAVTHIGRKSGAKRVTVLEVIHLRPQDGESIVVSAFGTRSDWYRNLAENPAIEIRTGRRRFKPTHRVLPPDEARQVAEAFVRDHPREAALLPRAFAAIGALDRIEDGNDPVAILRSRPMIAFRPMPESHLR